MRAVTFQSIYQGVLRRLGLDPVGDVSTHDTGRSIARHIATRCRTVWTYWEWPEITRTEERAYRALWTASSQYVRVNSDGKPDEIYYLANATYYRVNPDATTDPPIGTTPTTVVTPAYFISFVPTTKFIERDQLGQRPMGPVIGVWDTDPSEFDTSWTSGALAFTPSERGITIQNGPATTVFVQYILDIPRPTMVPFIFGKSYAVGDKVLYLLDGNCYRCTTPSSSHSPSDTAFWSIELIPEFLSSYLEAGVFADCMRESRGDGDEGARAQRQAAIADADAEAQDYLRTEIDTLLRQGQRYYYGNPRQLVTTWRLDGSIWFARYGTQYCSKGWTGNIVHLLTDPTPITFSGGGGGGAPPLPRNVYSLTSTSGLTTQAVSSTALANSNLFGVSWAVRWDQLETSSGVFNATELARMDAELTRIAAVGKKIFLRWSGVGGSAASAHGDIPDWVYTALTLTPSALTIVPGISYTFNDHGAFDAPTIVRCLPCPFNTTFTAKQVAFITKLGVHIATLSDEIQNAITHINLPIFNLITDDWQVPTGSNIETVGGPLGTGYDRSEIHRWLDTVGAGGAGYTTAAMITAAKALLNATVAAFPNQKIYMPFGSNGTQLDRVASQAAGYPVPQLYLAHVIQAYAATTYPGVLVTARNTVAAAAMNDAPAPANDPMNFLYGISQTSELVGGRMLFAVHGDTQFIVNNGSPVNTKVNATYPNAILTETEILEQSRDHGQDYGMSMLEVLETDVVNLPGAIAH